MAYTYYKATNSNDVFFCCALSLRNGIGLLLGPYSTAEAPGTRIIFNSEVSNA